MYSSMFTTADHAAHDALKEMMYGNCNKVAGTYELALASFTILQPLKRVCLLNGRNGNVFAQIAETLWMLSGRDDLTWLERYIPQCKNWSDDGLVWRAAYGPRLRAWESHNRNRRIDQILECVHKLFQDPTSRQAVVSIWDPAHDWVVGSKDYPCNNWLHWIIRNGHLHMNVVVRSNDVIYGFTHADFFAWSVLHQLMAYTLKVNVGRMHWNATSFHMYERHENKARKIIAQNDAERLSDAHRAAISLPTYTSLYDFDSVVMNIFAEEDVSRRNVAYPNDYYAVPAPDLVPMMGYMLKIYNAHLNGANIDTINTYINAMPECDMKVAARLYFQR